MIGPDPVMKTILLYPTLRNLFALFLVTGLWLDATATDASNPVVLLLTAETHASFTPSGRPENLQGGMSRRATVVTELRKKHPQLLLLDGGGAFAGGIYDDLTMGDSLDRRRSLLYAGAMAQLKYDAMAVGDEELHFGPGLLTDLSRQTTMKFLSANVAPTPGLLPFHIFKRNGVRIAVIGLTTQEFFSPRPVGITVGDPQEALASVLEKIRGKTDAIVVLCHLGEDLSTAIADSFPVVDVILNAHRKKGIQPLRRHNRTWLVQFSFQARELHEFHLFPGRQDFKEFHVHPLDSRVKDDPQMTPFLRQWDAMASPRPILMDLYVMSHCPYGTEAEEWLLPLADRLNAGLNLKYIVSNEGGKWTSLHGQTELEENLRQMILQQQMPGRLFPYIQCVNQSPQNWRKCLEKSGVDPDKFAEKTKHLGEHLLKADYARTERLSIRSSPTLYVYNRPYDGRMEETALLRHICARAKIPPAICSEVPECDNDSDCRMPGKEGACFHPGTPQSRCVFRDAEPFEVMLLSDSGIPVETNLEELWTHTAELFPGAHPRRMDISHPEAIRLAKRLGIQRIPAILFEGKVAKAPRFKEIQASLRQSQGYYLLQEAHYRNPSLWNRPAKRREVILYWTPLDPQANEILSRLLALAQTESKDLAEMAIRPVLTRDSLGISSPNGKMELEEIKRQLAIPPQKLVSYLRERQKLWPTSYWEDAFEQAGLRPSRIKKAAARKRIDKSLARYFELQDELGPIENPIFFLVENRQLVAPRNEGDLAKLLELIP